MTWKNRWLHPNAQGKHSSLHGLGVFANAPIKKGEIIAVLGGIIVPAKDILLYWEKQGHIGIQFHEEFFIVPEKRKDLEETGVFNHSCKPNIGFYDSNIFVAIKDIKKGEELCFDYAFNEILMKPFVCACNSTNCRKMITAQDWKLPHIQKNYANYISPHVKRLLK